MNWITAFILTQVIEITVGNLFWREPEVSKKRKILTIFVASLITHPMVWFVFSDIRHDGGFSYNEYLLMAESYAYGVEAWYYYILKVKRPILLSVIANTCSFGAGLFIYSFIL